MQINKYSLLFILLGTLIWSLTMVKSGLTYSYGMGFWGANGHDGVWHISLANSLLQGSLDMPTYSGEKIKNYHIGFDLLLAGLSKVSKVSTNTLYFQILPPLIALFSGLTLYKFVLTWTNSSSATNWSLFFLYFGGSWGWLFGKGESMFWSQQSISTLINPPFALSLPIFFTGLYFLHLYYSQPTKRNLIASSILFGLLVAIKVYAAVLVILSLLFCSLFNKRNLPVFILTLVVSTCLFLPLNSKSASLLVFSPGWFLETMMAVSDRVGWTRFYQAMITYKATLNFPKLIISYLVATAIFIFGNLGTRIVFLKNAILQFRGTINSFLLTIGFLGLILPLIFIQSGTPWNTIQFTYYSLITAGILAGSTLYKTRLLSLPGLFVIIATLPTTYETLKHYLPSTPPAAIFKNELEALNFLKTKERGIVLAPVAVIDNYKPAPRPLYQYESTAYVSAFSKQKVFFENSINLNILNIPWRDREKQVNEFFKSNDLIYSKNFIQKNNIKYIYLPDIASNRPNFSAEDLGGKGIFENAQVSIWQVGDQ